MPLRRVIRAVRERLVRLRFKESEDAFEITRRQEFFRRAFKALSFNQIDGDYVEFGSWTGMTLFLAYHESRRHELRCKLWTFDSFEGFPPLEGPADDHPRWQAASNIGLGVPLEKFHRICARNGIPSADYEVVPGYYRESLKKGTANLPSNISLAYIDCDLYSSTRDVLDFLMPRMKHGMIIACDDYYCWSATQVAGERRALGEAFRDNAEWRLVPFVQFCWAGMSFVVERKDLYDAPSMSH